MPERNWFDAFPDEVPDDIFADFEYVGEPIELAPIVGEPIELDPGEPIEPDPVDPPLNDAWLDNLIEIPPTIPPPPPQPDISCKICFNENKPVEVVYIPCGHIIACLDCDNQAKSHPTRGNICSVCRTPIVLRQKIFFA
jgi:hypothetical protein